MKDRIRKQVRQILLEMPREVAADKSHAACTALVALREFQAADAVMIYLPMPAEVDSAAVALHAWQQDKTVLVPKVDWEQRHMMAVEIRSLEDDLPEGKYGIRQPATGSPWPVEDIDFIVVPALAYDRRGNRLGRGSGFYDRFLATAGMRAVTCGLAFQEQVLDLLPIHQHDRGVDLLVTDAEVLRFNRRGHEENQE